MTNTKLLRPIETRYMGYRFRSRLEARWAVFFDAVGVIWEYEPEGFVLPSGTCYLPDFRLTGYRIQYVEIKPISVRDDAAAFAQAKTLCSDLARCLATEPVWLIQGDPVDNLASAFIGPQGVEDFKDVIATCNAGGLLSVPKGRTNANGAVALLGSQIVTRPGWAGAMVSRSARFEHGEKGGAL